MHALSPGHIVGSWLKERHPFCPDRDVIKGDYTGLCLFSLFEGFVLFTRTTTLCCITLCLFVFCLLVVLVRLSVPVQVIDWKDSSLK